MPLLNTLPFVEGSDHLEGSSYERMIMHGRPQGLPLTSGITAQTHLIPLH
jgi:hypothetical protein